MQARQSIWILTIAGSAAVHAVLFSFLLRVPFILQPNTAPEVFRVAFKPLYPTSRAVDIAEVTKAQLVGAPAAQVLGAPGPPVLKSPLQRPLKALPGDSTVDAEETTVANSEAAEEAVLLSNSQPAKSPIDATSASKAASQVTMEPTSEQVQKHAHKTWIVSQGVEVEPITAKGINEVSPGESADMEAEVKATEISSKSIAVRLENPLIPSTRADMVATAAKAKSFRADSRAVPSFSPARADVGKSIVQTLKTSDETATVQPIPAQPARKAPFTRKLLKPRSEPSEILDEFALNEHDISQETERLAMLRELTGRVTPATRIDEEVIQPLPTTAVPMEEYKSAESIKKSAEASYQSRAFKESLALVQRGLSAAPRHPGLLALRSEILQALETRRKKRKVRALLDKARQQLAALRLTLPAGSNAVDTYGQILSIDPHNQQALRSVHTIPEHYESLAAARREQGNLHDGLRLVTLGLKVDANHPGLLSLRTEIQGLLTAQSDQKRQLDKLFAQLQQLLEEKEIAQTSGEKAYGIIQSIFRVDPDNLRAMRALRQLMARFESLARASRRAGALRQSLAFVEAALKIEPENLKLLVLRQNVSANIKATQPPGVGAQSPVGAQSTRQPEPASKPKEAREQPSLRIFGTF